MRYVVTIFHSDTFAPDVESAVGDAAGVSILTRVTIKAGNPRQAAARAYVRRVGKVRSRLFREMNAPQALVEFETSVRSVGKALRRGPSGLGDYYHDNLVEAWYFRVEEGTSPRRACCERSRPCSESGPHLPWRFATFFTPSLN